MDSETLATCQHAAQHVKKGGIIAYPTEAVYGLGCDPWQEKAVQTLLDLKQRPRKNGLIVLASSWQACKDHVQNTLPEQRLQAVLKSWPGPYTWLLPNKDFPGWITGEHDTVAIRVSAHPIASKLCELAGGLLVSTSANQSQQPPMTTAKQVQAQWSTTLDAIIENPVGKLTQPTCIKDAATGKTIR
jgi:L-threonylcarbamoyladenylate synthase